LYTIHYDGDRNAEIRLLQEELAARGGGLAALDAFLAFVGERAFGRAEPLLSAKSLLKFAPNLIGIDGNKFSLWQPALAAILTRFTAGIRMDAQFPVQYPALKGRRLSVKANPGSLRLRGDRLSANRTLL
jgi:hypothetical protein